MSDFTVFDEERPGIELLHIRSGEPGYQDEDILLSNSLGNGFRIEIGDSGDDGCGCYHVFHFHEPDTARRIAGKLIEWSNRIGCPPPHPIDA